MSLEMCDESARDSGAFCQYCGRLLRSEHAILNCISCEKQGCYNCICAGACCAEENWEAAN